jgi:hypothetical protein
MNKNVKARDHFEDLKVDRRIILKYAVTYSPMARQRLNKHIPRQRIRNNIGHPFLGNGCFLRGPTRGHIMRSQQYLTVQLEG